MKKLKVLSREINWWWPLLYGLIGIGLTGIVIWTDSYVSKWFPVTWKTTLDLAQAIHSSVFTGLLAMMTFTFSTILVVLTTYSSQFSPRTLPNFIENRQVQHIFGIFIGAVSYSITMLFFPSTCFENEHRFFCCSRNSRIDFDCRFCSIHSYR